MSYIKIPGPKAIAQAWASTIPECSGQISVIKRSANGKGGKYGVKNLVHLWFAENGKVGKHRPKQETSQWKNCVVDLRDSRREFVYALPAHSCVVSLPLNAAPIFAKHGATVRAEASYSARDLIAKGEIIKRVKRIGKSVTSVEFGQYEVHGCNQGLLVIAGTRSPVKLPSAPAVADWIMQDIKASTAKVSASQLPGPGVEVCIGACPIRAEARRLALIMQVGLGDRCEVFIPQRAPKEVWVRGAAGE